VKIVKNNWGFVVIHARLWVSIVLRILALFIVLWSADVIWDVLQSGYTQNRYRYHVEIHPVPYYGHLFKNLTFFALSLYFLTFGVKAKE
jgi:hypothetical protein